MAIARPSRRWGHFRIITGTILGGILGFYVMHRVENSYKEKMKQRLAIYEREKNMKEQMEEKPTELFPLDESIVFNKDMLPFPDPAKLRTRRVIFENAFHARDSVTLEQLRELSSRRKVIEDSINGESFMTEAIAREMAGGLTSKTQQDLQKLEFYLPLLENLVTQIELLDNEMKSKILRCISNLQIRWSSALSEQSVFNFGGPKFYKIDKLQLELGLGIYLYGSLLRERASETSEDVVEAATLLRKAAGVYMYVANDLLPLQRTLPYEKPLEVVSSTSEIMSLVCLAEAQMATIKKAEELDRSPALLSKLHHGVTQMLDKAALILKTNAGNLTDASTRLREFISSSSFLHQMRSQRRLAEGLAAQHRAGDANGQLGVAIAILHVAIANSKDIKPPKDESWRSALDREMASVTEALKRFKQDNDFVYHEKLPDHDQLPTLQGAQIVEVIPYQPQRWERHLDFVV